jgi:hypothetical protein
MFGECWAKLECVKFFVIQFLIIKVTYSAQVEFAHKPWKKEEDDDNPPCDFLNYLICKMSLRP